MRRYGHWCDSGLITIWGLYSLIRIKNGALRKGVNPGDEHRSKVYNADRLGIFTPKVGR